MGIARTTDLTCDTPVTGTITVPTETDTLRFPFNPVTTFHFRIQRSSFVTLQIFDAAGRCPLTTA